MVFIMLCYSKRVIIHAVTFAEKTMILAVSGIICYFQYLSHLSTWQQYYCFHGCAFMETQNPVHMHVLLANTR